MPRILYCILCFTAIIMINYSLNSLFHSFKEMVIFDIGDSWLIFTFFILQLDVHDIFR